MTLDKAKERPDLAALAKEARWQVIKTVTSSKAGHIGGPLSMMDLLVTLYFEELNVRPEQPDWPDRDRSVLSKGHAAIGLYAVLALRGFLPVDELPTFDKAGSRLQGHPDATRLPVLDSSTGRPTVIVAQTLKGKGLSLSEGTYTWHSTVPTVDELAQAQRELDAAHTDQPESANGVPA